MEVAFPRDVLLLIKSYPGNLSCCDCNNSLDTDWGNINHGTLHCLECAGKHRSLGVNVSFMRSIHMDTWSPFQIEMMRQGGNGQLQQYLIENNVLKQPYGSHVSNSHSNSHQGGHHQHHHHHHQQKHIAGIYLSTAAERYRHFLKDRVNRILAGEVNTEPSSTLTSSSITSRNTQQHATNNVHSPHLQKEKQRQQRLQLLQSSRARYDCIFGEGPLGLTISRDADDDMAVVTKIALNGQAQHKGVCVGDVVVAVEDIDLSDYQSVLREITSSPRPLLITFARVVSSGTTTATTSTVTGATTTTTIGSMMSLTMPTPVRSLPVTLRIPKVPSITSLSSDNNNNNNDSNKSSPRKKSPRPPRHPSSDGIGNNNNNNNNSGRNLNHSSLVVDEDGVVDVVLSLRGKSPFLDDLGSTVSNRSFSNSVDNNYNSNNNGENVISPRFLNGFGILNINSNSLEGSGRQRLLSSSNNNNSLINSIVEALANDSDASVDDDDYINSNNNNKSSPLKERLISMSQHNNNNNNNNNNNSINIDEVVLSISEAIASSKQEQQQQQHESVLRDVFFGDVSLHDNNNNNKNDNEEDNEDDGDVSVSSDDEEAVLLLVSHHNNNNNNNNNNEQSPPHIQQSQQQRRMSSDSGNNNNNNSVSKEDNSNAVARLHRHVDVLNFNNNNNNNNNVSDKTCEDQEVSLQRLEEATLEVGMKVKVSVRCHSQQQQQQQHQQQNFVWKSALIVHINNNNTLQLQLRDGSLLSLVSVERVALTEQQFQQQQRKQQQRQQQSLEMALAMADDDDDSFTTLSNNNNNNRTRHHSNDSHNRRHNNNNNNNNNKSNYHQHHYLQQQQQLQRSLLRTVDFRVTFDARPFGMTINNSNNNSNNNNNSPGNSILNNSIVVSRVVEGGKAQQLGVFIDDVVVGVNDVWIDSVQAALQLLLLSPLPVTVVFRRHSYEDRRNTDVVV